jgi:hypothetical protein
MAYASSRTGILRPSTSTPPRGAISSRRYVESKDARSCLRNDLGHGSGFVDSSNLNQSPHKGEGHVVIPRQLKELLDSLVDETEREFTVIFSSIKTVRKLGGYNRLEKTIKLYPQSNPETELVGSGIHELGLT